MAKTSNAKSQRPVPGELDPLIHERLRLGILSALTMHESLSFTELRDLLATTDGNLSVQARKLEEAGYVVCQKKFVGRKPNTTYRLTSRGRAALESYLETLERILPPMEQVRHAVPARRTSIRPVPAEG